MLYSILLVEKLIALSELITWESKLEKSFSQETIVKRVMSINLINLEFIFSRK